MVVLPPSLSIAFVAKLVLYTFHVIPALNVTVPMPLFITDGGATPAPASRVRSASNVAFPDVKVTPPAIVAGLENVTVVPAVELINKLPVPSAAGISGPAPMLAVLL